MLIILYLLFCMCSNSGIILIINTLTGVGQFAAKIKESIVQAHDPILEARIKQTRDTNRKRWEPPFQTRDLIYLSRLNLSLPKGSSIKLTPKFIRSYTITRNWSQVLRFPWICQRNWSAGRFTMLFMPRWFRYTSQMTTDISQVGNFTKFQRV